MSGEEGGLPVYPGLKRVHETHSGALCGSAPCAGRPPFRVTLAHTHDPADQVEAFYAERLAARSGWRRVETEETTIFCTEDADEAFARGALMVPSVTLRASVREGFPTQVQFIFEAADREADL